MAAVPGDRPMRTVSRYGSLFPLHVLKYCTILIDTFQKGSVSESGTEPLDSESLIQVPDSMRNGLGYVQYVQQSQV